MCIKPALVLVMGCLICSLPNAAPIDVDVARESLVFLTVEKKEPSGKLTSETGTGFIITSDGYIITSGHLISEAFKSTSGQTKIWAKRRSRNSPEAPVQLEFLFSGCCDLVALKYPDQGLRFQFLRLASRTKLARLKLNDPLTIIGFGLENDLAPANGTLGNKGGNFIDGNISNIWLFNAPANWGNSGSPVFDVDGYVIGVVKGGISGAQGSNYFVPMDLVRTMLGATLDIDAQQEVISASRGVAMPPKQFPASAPPPVPTRTMEKASPFQADKYLWTNNTIPVCWENESAEFEEKKDWVKSAVSETWQANSAINFSGWGKCTVGDKGVRIQIDDSVPPHTVALGRQLDGVANGVKLTLSFAEFSPSCANFQQQCVKSIAVHTFGHVLGFAHTNNRSDTPIDCKTRVSEPAESQGMNFESVLPYDKHSVMNYCNPVWNNGGKLSSLDKLALQIVYGVRE